MEKWTEEQWKSYDEFRERAGLSSRVEMGNALKAIHDRMVRDGYIKQMQ
jgi:hypothetical protein